MAKKEKPRNNSSGGCILLLIAIIGFGAYLNSKPATTPIKVTPAMRATTHPKTELLGQAIIMIPAITSITSVSILVPEKDPHINIDARTKAGYNTSEIADLIRSQAITVLDTDSMEIEIILSDDKTSTLYIWENANQHWRVANIDYVNAP